MGEIGFRKFRETDAKQLAKMANNKKIWRNMRDRFPHPYTLKDAQNMIARSTASNPGEYIFAITLNDEVIGSVGGFAQEDVYAHNMEIGYWVAEDHWNKGYGTQAVQWITDYLFKNADVNRLFAGVFAYNIASANVMDKAGYRQVARVRQKVYKDGAYYDELLFDMLREDWLS